MSDNDTSQQGEAVTDSRGNALGEGDRVEAWLDGERYTATVKEIKPHRAGDGNFRWIVLVREGDLREIQSFSDAAITLADLPAEGEAAT